MLFRIYEQFFTSRNTFDLGTFVKMLLFNLINSKRRTLEKISRRLIKKLVKTLKQGKYRKILYLNDYYSLPIQHFFINTALYSPRICSIPYIIETAKVMDLSSHFLIGVTSIALLK